MARPMKNGMEYFPHDTDACSDEKIESMRFLHGNDGYAFYFIMLERIYRNSMYYCDVSAAETTQILAYKVGVTVEKFNCMLETALRLGCFDREEYEKHKRLTSNGIKKRASSVQAKRDKQRKKSAGVIEAETTQKLDDNHPETPERKAKQSKAVSYTSDFDSFWASYPRHDGKHAAFRAWNARIKDGATPADMTTAAKNYAAHCVERGTEPQYIKMPATFLNPDWIEWRDKKVDARPKPTAPGSRYTDEDEERYRASFKQM
jgi:hypothetical protein